MTIELRDYQRSIIDAVYAEWESGIDRTLVVAPTGSGKTLIFSTIVSEQVRQHGRLPLILVNRDELVRQTVASVKRVDPRLSVGVIQAGRHEVDREVVVASVQTLMRRLGEGKKGVPSDRFDLIIADEAHHLPSKGNMAIIRHFGAMDGGAKLVGFTATPSRADGIGLGIAIQSIAYEYTLIEAIESGYLVRPEAYRVQLDDLDLGAVKVRGGDYVDGALGGAMLRSGRRIAEAILSHGMNGSKLRRGVCFAPTVDCAAGWCEDFRAAGIRTEVVVGTTPIEERQRIYAALTEHRIDMLLGVSVFLEGWDLPAVEMVVMGRPTKSQALYVQALGRGLRLSPETGKKDCLILDVCGGTSADLVVIADLGIPDACGCQCDCEVARGCSMECRCPRTRSGRLLPPCIICRKYDIPKPCPHYFERHVVGCEHRCSGPGRPGTHMEEEVEALGGEEEGGEVAFDDTEIELEKVDLLAGASRTPLRPKRSAWLKTRGGIEFLPAANAEESTLFLWPEGDGLFTVGELQKRGPAERIKSGLTYDEAVREACLRHPRGGKPQRPLQGAATDGQRAFLVKLGVWDAPENLTKQQASEMINIALISSRLDG